MIDRVAIRKRVQAATKGPWGVDVDLERADGVPFIHGHDGTIIRADDEAELADLEFAAAARTDVPALLEVIDAMMSALLEADEYCGTRTGLVPGRRIYPALALIGLDTQEKRDAEWARIKEERP